MKILWVKANKLLPLHSGGDIRSYHIARHLASRHELCFFSYFDGKPDAKYERELAQDFPRAFCMATGKSRSAPARAMDYALKLKNPAPYAVSRFESTAVRKQLESWLTSERFDVAVCDFLDAAVNFDAWPTPAVLFQHNVESEIWRRHSETEANPVKRAICALEFKKMLAYEKATLPRFQQVIAVSEHDKELMGAWIDRSQISVIPTGVDLRQFQGVSSDRTRAPLVVFIGAMDWEPNIDAVEFFCKDIWPQILAAVPEAKFRIVGRNPVRRVQHLTCESVEVTGRVPAVVDHLRDAAVVVVPLRIGGGTRLKIYEAMAAGKAIVSTSIGAEGLDVHHGRDIILADGATNFGASVSLLLKDEAMRNKYERAAAELAARYDWSNVGAEFEAILEKVTSGVMPRAI